MNDLSEAVERARARQDAADLDVWLPFSGFDLGLEHLEAFIGTNAYLAFETFTEENVLLVLRDLAANMLLTGLMFGEIRRERERLAKREAV